MIFSFLKKTFIFSLLLSTAFSSVPSFIIEEGVKIAFNNNNVVDRIWLSNRDTNVVDQFEPFTKVVERLKVGTALAAAQGDGKIFYSISANTTPRTRDYVASSNSFSAAVSTVASSTALQSVIKASPTKDEMIAGYVNATGGLQVMCWNGTSWTNEWTLALGGTGTTRRFDIAYETSTGDAIVLYSRNVATTNELAYRTKPGGSACGSANWAAATNLDATRTTGIVQWVKLASDRRATASSTTAIWADANADLSARSWNGSAWGSEPAAVLEATLEGATTAPDVESFDVEYESLSGEAMVVWSTTGAGNGTNGIKYATSTVAGVWGAATALTTTPALRQEGTALDISANPNTNEIVFASIGNGRTTLQAAYWSGSAWTTSVAPNGVDMTTATAAPLAGTKFVSTGWLISGATTRSVIVYYDLNATNIGWAVGNGSSFTIQTDASPTPAFGVQKNYDVKMDPINKDRLIFAVNDASSDIFAKRLIMDATPTFTWTDAAGGAAIEANTASVLYKTFDFEYNRFIPPTTTLSNFASAEPGNSTIAPGASGLVDSFGLVANTGTDTVSGATVTLAAGTGARVATVSIVNNGDTVTYCSATPSGDIATLATCGIPVTTTNTQFKIKITAISHAAMPVPPGANYDVTGTITSFTITSSNAKSGTDSGSSTLTIHNLSPNGATAVSGTAGDTKNTINWTTSSSADFNTTSGSVIYRWASSTAGVEVPAEGSTPTIGTSNGTASTTCVVSSAISTALSKIDGTGGSAECTTTALTNGQAYTYKVFQKDTSGNYDVGVLIGTFTPAVGITVTGYTNGETALNYSAACAGCGARIGGGAFAQTITITGTGFGADPGVGQRSTATNNIKVGTHQIASANVTAWSATSITFLTDSSVTGDLDADWGANYGGASALVVTAGGGTATGLNFYVFPQITSITQPGGLGADSAREYATGDTDGVITLNGTRFGSSQGTGSVTIVGQATTTTTWTSTAISMEIPTAISDTTATGTIVMIQGTGSSGKAHTFGNPIRILPRILSNTLSTDVVGNKIKILGNHFCQGVSCPVSPNRSLASDNVKFGTTQALESDFVNAGTAPCTGNAQAWIATEICVMVPAGTPLGPQPTIVTSNTAYLSNTMAFTIPSTVPNDPTLAIPKQYKSDGSTVIVHMTATNESTVILKADMTAGLAIGMALQVEVEATGGAFDGLGIVQGTVGGGGACASCTSLLGAQVTVAGLTGGDKQWRARVINTTSLEVSGWVTYVNPSTAEVDFTVDTTGPVITFPGGDICSGAVSQLGTNSAQINWSVNESSTGQVQYSVNSDLAGSVLYPTTPAAANTTHQFTLSNLNSGTTYYFKAKSQDNAGNLTSRPSVAAYCLFTTGSNLPPSKTTRFHIAGSTGTINNGNPLSQSFSVTIPENATTTKSVFVEIRGYYSAGATINDIAVQVNAETAKTYAIPDVSAKSYFKILHQVNAINIAPGTNTLTITPQTNTSVSLSSADMYVNYTYTP